MSPSPPPPPPTAAQINADVQRALDEDSGPGDLTAQLIAQPARAQASIIAREPGVLAGAPWAEACFKHIDPTCNVSRLRNDGDRLTKDAVILTVTGPARALLTAERPALNFLQTLSATATATARYVAAVQGTGARVLDTRKTLPGLRRAQKYAVLCGGGCNHRMGLFDAVLIKENHIAAAGSVGHAVRQAYANAHGAWVEIEVQSLDELTQALDAGAQRILLDNFQLDDLRAAVALNAGRARLEASGGINLNTLRAIAETGVHDISVGAITKDIKALDLSMRFTP